MRQAHVLFLALVFAGCSATAPVATVEQRGCGGATAFWTGEGSEDGRGVRVGPLVMRGFNSTEGAVIERWTPGTLPKTDERRGSPDCPIGQGAVAS